MAERRNSEDHPDEPRSEDQPGETEDEDRPDEADDEDRPDEADDEDRPDEAEGEDSDEDGAGEESDSERITGTAPSGADISELEKFEPSEEAKRAEPSAEDAMGQDKRRQVFVHSYGPSAKRQIMFFVIVAVVLVVIIGGWLALVAAFDKPPTHFADQSPWSKTQTDPQLAAQQNAAQVAPSSPCGEPGNQYPPPPSSPCAPPKKTNGNQGANSSNVPGVSKGQ